MAAARTAEASPSVDASLSQWLAWLEQLHPVEIELGLDRIERVAQRAGLTVVGMPLITVGGTNGKGSTVAMLEAIYQASGYRTGVYTSPHIERFNERIAIQDEMVADATIIAALRAIEAVRNDESLTYYEFTTLAAMLIFRQFGCQVVILEVGLGGRLDATNLWAADCAIVTSIALDHQAWLGSDRAAISLEKVAIGRHGRPMIIGDDDPPPVMLEHARQAGMQIIQPPVDQVEAPKALPGAHQQRNAACALAAVDALQTLLPVESEQARRALHEVRVAGRMDWRHWHGREVLLDVAHNPAAASALAEVLARRSDARPVDVVFATLADKDAAGIVAALAGQIRQWHCVQLEVPRATPVATLVDTVLTHTGALSGPQQVIGHASAAAAWQGVTRSVAGPVRAGAIQAASAANTAPLILVTGSFYTLSAVLAAWDGHDA